MKTLRRPLVMLLLMLFVGLSTVPISAQRTKKSSKRPPKSPEPTKPVSFEDQQLAKTVEQLLAQSGQKYFPAGGGVWVIIRNGKYYESFQIRLSLTAGTLKSEAIIAKAASLKIDEVALNLLRLKNDLDYVAVGLNRGDDLFVRNEARVKSLDIDEFRNNIESVATAADKVFEKVKPFRIDQ